MSIAPDYLREIKKRGKTSRVYKDFQLLGLEIAESLNDEKNKSIYIKLAKTNDHQELRRVAREVASRKGVKNKGAYFMKAFFEEKKRSYKKWGWLVEPRSKMQWY